MPKLIKIDVEGFELPVLLGGINTLESSECNAIIIELNGSGKRYGWSDQDIHQLICSKGFVPIEYNPLERIIRVMSTYNKDGFNTIYIRNIEKARREIRAAPAIAVGRYSI